MKFRKQVTAEEAHAWYAKYSQHANLLPWRGFTNGSVYISVASPKGPCAAGPITIVVEPIGPDDLWMEFELFDFNRLDFGEQTCGADD
jgi:hypothetical protein